MAAHKAAQEVSLTEVYTGVNMFFWSGTIQVLISVLVCQVKRTLVLSFIHQNLPPAPRDGTAAGFFQGASSPD